MTADRMLRMARMLRRENDGAHKPERAAGKEIFIPVGDGEMRALHYAPAGATAAPLFVDLHGGAFIFGSPEEDDDFCARLCETLGMAVLSLDYPLAPEARYPAALEAIYAAIQAVRRDARRYGIDGENISVGGHSAGGNLAAAICLMAARRGDLPLRCQLLDYPATDMGATLPQEARHRDPLELSQKLLDFAAECYADRRQYEEEALCTPCRATMEQMRGLPPAVVLTCGRDSLRTEGEVYAQMLVSAGVTLRFRRFAEARHGFTVFPDPLRAEGQRFLFDGLRDFTR